MNRFLLSASIVFLMGFGCSKPQQETSTTVKTKKPNEAYVIYEAVPDIALPGTLITIYGEYFPDTELKVKFDGILADSIVEASNEFISVFLPKLDKRDVVSVEVSSHNGKWVSNKVSMEVMANPEGLADVYWTTHNLFRGKLSEDGFVTYDRIFDERNPRGLQIDHDSNLAYWGTGLGQVFKGNIETKEVSQLASVESDMLDIVFDKKREWVYLAYDSIITRVPLNEPKNEEVLFINCNKPGYMELSENEDYIYWSEQDNVKIKRGKISGGQQEVLLEADNGLGGPRGFYLHGNKMFIADCPRFGKSSIYEFDMKTKALKPIWSTEKDAVGEYIVDVTIDTDNGYMYWMNSKGKNKHNHHDGAIWRAPLDGSESPKPIFQSVNFGYRLTI